MYLNRSGKRESSNVRTRIKSLSSRFLSNRASISSYQSTSLSWSCSSLIPAFISTNDRPVRLKIVTIIIKDRRLKASSIDSRSLVPSRTHRFRTSFALNIGIAVPIRFNWCFSIVFLAPFLACFSSKKEWLAFSSKHVYSLMMQSAHQIPRPADFFLFAPYFLAACSLTPYIPTWPTVLVSPSRMRGLNV